MNVVNEQTSYLLKTGGFSWVEKPDGESPHILATHLESKLVVRVDPGDTPQDVVSKLIRQARKFP